MEKGNEPRETGSCFFCTTPYQVLAVISIVQNEKIKNADVYVYDQFDGYAELIRKLENTGLFRKVYPIEQEKMLLEVDLATTRLLTLRKAAMLLLYIKNMIFMKSTVKKYLAADIIYKRIYVSTNNFAGRYTILYYMKHKRSLQVVFFDDGIGSYFSDDSITKIRLYDKIGRLLFVGRKAINIPFVKQIYSPEFYASVKRISGLSDAGQATEIIKITPLERNDNNDRIVSDVFGCLQNTDISQDIIYFDTIKAEEFNARGRRVLDRLISNILKVLGRENIIFKFHPRDRYYNKELPHFDDSRIPFECFCYFNDFSEKVFITNFSTAVFTPKILYDQEPVIVFLYEIMREYMIIPIDTGIVEALKETYHNKEKILIPGTVKELLGILDKLK